MLGRKTIVLSLILLAFFVNPVMSAVSITPSSGTYQAGTPIQFRVTGLNASHTYDVEVDDIVEYDSLAPSSEGTLTFTVIIDETGNHKVEIVDETGGSVVATANIQITNIIEDVIPWLNFVLMFIIVFAVYEGIEKGLKEVAK